jgi:hypothetical protein
MCHFFAFPYYHSQRLPGNCRLVLPGGEARRPPRLLHSINLRQDPASPLFSSLFLPKQTSHGRSLISHRSGVTVCMRITCRRIQRLPCIDKLCSKLHWTCAAFSVKLPVITIYFTALLERHYFDSVCQLCWQWLESATHCLQLAQGNTFSGVIFCTCIEDG